MVSILRGLFKREPKNCEQCGTPVERRHLLDGTWRGEFKMERQRQLCTACLRYELETGFSAVRNKCVLAQPVVKSNAYYAYTDSDKHLRVALGGERGGVSGDEIDATRHAIRWLTDQISGSCDFCGDGTPNFTWLPGEAFDHKWWNFNISEIAKSNPEFSALCPACAATAVVEAVETIGLRLDEVWAPRDGTVLMFSGEA